MCTYIHRTPLPFSQEITSFFAFSTTFHFILNRIDVGLNDWTIANAENRNWNVQKKNEIISINIFHYSVSHSLSLDKFYCCIYIFHVHEKRNVQRHSIQTMHKRRLLHRTNYTKKRNKLPYSFMVDHSQYLLILLG